MPRIKPTKSRVFYKGAPVSTYESYTSLSRWWKCETEYARWYWSFDKDPVTLPLVLGNAFHALVEDTLKDKMLGGTMSPASIRTRWETHWLMELDGAERKGSGLKVESTSPEAYFERGRELTNIWIRDWLPKVKPRDVEVPFLLKLSGIDREIYGRLDYTEDGDVLDDLKTSGQTYNKNLYETQFAIYHVAHQSLYGVLPKAAWVIRAETKAEPVIEPIDILLSKPKLQEIFNDTIRPTMEKISKAWETGIFNCTCKGEKKHKSIDFFEEDQKWVAEHEKQQEANDRILNPEKYKGEVKPPKRDPQLPIPLEEIPF